MEVDKFQILKDESPIITNTNTTLENILLGRPYSLEEYQSLSSKTSLIDAAIKSGDGNAILGVILLKIDIFYKFGKFFY